MATANQVNSTSLTKLLRFITDKISTDYVWIDPNTGEIKCWLNNLPEPWSSAGTNNSIIGSGVGRGQTVYLAVCPPNVPKSGSITNICLQDMNGDGVETYVFTLAQYILLTMRRWTTTSL